MRRTRNSLWVGGVKIFSLFGIQLWNDWNVDRFQSRVGFSKPKFLGQLQRERNKQTRRVGVDLYVTATWECCGTQAG